MSSLLARRLHSLSPSSLTGHNDHLNLLFPLFRLSLSTQTQPQKELPFITDYLISSFGLSPDRALKYSRYAHMAAIKSPDPPESVVKFLKDTGLSDSQIKAAVSFYPLLLGSNVETTLKPKVCELLENGFSEELLIQLIRRNPSALALRRTLSNLQYWRDFVGKSDDGLLKIIQKNPLLINFDIDKHIVPRINLLKEYGLSNRDIMSMLGTGTCYITRSLDYLRQRLDFIEEMGIPRGSRMFLHGFKAIGSFASDRLLKKVEFFKVTYGWSEDEVSSAFKKFPAILSISEEKLKSNMGFLVSNAKLDPRRIALRPTFLAFSLERRLVPRHHVLSILHAKGLKKRWGLLSACNISEKDFLEKFVIPYKESVPEVAEAYPGNLPT